MLWDKLYRLSCDLAPDGAALLSEADVVLPLDNLSDTQYGEFDFHILECDWERLILSLALDQTSALVEQLVSTSCGGEVASFGSWSGFNQVDVLWNMFPNPCRVGCRSTIDEAENLVGATLEFYMLRSQCFPDFLVCIWNGGQVRMRTK